MSEIAARRMAAPVGAQAGTGGLPAYSPHWYSRAVWRWGHGAARWLPGPVRHGLAGALSVCWWLVAARRSRAVMRNLLPICGSPAAARRLSRRNFHEFARKLSDLWRFESGMNPAEMFGELLGWEHLEAAGAGGRGRLLVSPHLGNWELGGPLLAQRGHSLKVVTLAEPDGLGELRQAARARWGVETVVIGNGAFGFVEVVRQLQNGATVALLVDRPPPDTALQVQLFGRPFMASVAPAELARATGCAIIPVTIVRQGARYQGVAWPPVEYERAALRQPEARAQLIQAVMRALEPCIAAHPEQWFHFAPLWPEES